MSNKIILSMCLLIVLCVTSSVLSEVRYWKLRPLPSPERYGNILIDRISSKSGEKSVSFSHWMHRVKYTCNVCHSELGFELSINTTIITEDDNRNGKYCGACHNGETAFGYAEEHCDKCHNGDIDYGIEKFKSLSYLPEAHYGNRINWMRAIEEGLIEPATYLKDDSIQFNSKRSITIYSSWMYMYSNVQFPHESHGRWLDCTSCHTKIFNYESRTTDNLSMINILNKKFCGVCHGKVAFPINNCRRCHPAMKYS